MSRERQKLSARDYKHGPKRGPSLPLHYRTFAAGLGLGLLVAVGVHVMNQQAHAPVAEKPTPQPNAAKNVTDDNDTAVADPAAQYDFYSMLPKAEVVVNNQARPSRRDTTQAAVEQPGAYVLQVGAYRNRDDAERLRSKLDKLGIDARVQHVAIDADELHRVLVGPIRDLERLNATRRELRAAEIDVIMYRVGD